MSGNDQATKGRPDNLLASFSFLARARRGPSQLAGVWKKAKKGPDRGRGKAKSTWPGLRAHARGRKWEKSKNG